MGEHRLVVIATDPGFAPDDVTLRRAVRLVRELVPDADDVRGTVHDAVVFIDAGGNSQRIDCPACGSELDPAWWDARMERAARQGFARLAVTPPCCTTPTSLNDLAYSWPAGFARAEIVASKPQRGRLTTEELGRLAGVLHHPVREIRS